MTSRNVGGYIALVSSIILVSILLILSTSVAFLSITERLNVLDHQNKQDSLLLAWQCTDSILATLAVHLSTTSQMTGGCAVVSVDQDVPAPGQITLIVKTTAGRTVTNLQTIVNTVDFSVISQQEFTH